MGPPAPAGEWPGRQGQGIAEEDGAARWRGPVLEARGRALAQHFSQGVLPRLPRFLAASLLLPRPGPGAPAQSSAEEAVPARASTAVRGGDARRSTRTGMGRGAIDGGAVNGNVTVLTEAASGSTTSASL
ncbi:hypothetical protein KM043_006610 [Ampulex compressa]|nr:hypothetical protein KM043_006610 [Ampulex compressa]